jgi:hypothetical protein
MSRPTRIAQATLFLGAGASKAFGYPTTKEFLGLLLGRLSGQEKELLQALTEVPENSDIEHVLEILDQVVELENPFLKFLDKRQVSIPVQPSYLSSSVSGWKQFKTIASSLRLTTHDELFRQYQFEPSKHREISQVLKATLDFVAQDADVVHLFTTNYDSIVERGLSGSDWTALDGFTPSVIGGARWGAGFEIPKHWSDVVVRKFVYLYKLHGSLSWRLDKTSGGIVRIDTEERATDYSRVYGDNVLLYPASKRPPSREPYGNLYGWFVERLYTAPICVVIGFSFRDPFINTVFVNYLRRTNNIVLIFSPSADEAKKHLLDVLINDDSLASRVIPFNNSYGDPYTTSLIGAQVGKYKAILPKTSA